MSESISCLTPKQSQNIILYMYQCYMHCMNMVLYELENIDYGQYYGPPKRSQFIDFMFITKIMSSYHKIVQQNSQELLFCTTFHVICVDSNFHDAFISFMDCSI